MSSDGTPGFRKPRPLYSNLTAIQTSLCLLPGPVRAPTAASLPTPAPQPQFRREAAERSPRSAKEQFRAINAPEICTKRHHSRRIGSGAGQDGGAGGACHRAAFPCRTGASTPEQHPTGGQRKRAQQIKSKSYGDAKPGFAPRSGQGAQGQAPSPLRGLCSPQHTGPLALRAITSPPQERGLPGTPTPGPTSPRPSEALAWAASSAGRALLMEVTSPQGSLMISKMTRQEESSHQRSLGERDCKGRTGTGGNAGKGHFLHKLEGY